MADLSQRATMERRRAARAAAVAAEFEGRLNTDPASLRPLCSRLAELHRRLEARHLSAARLHEAYASSLDRWAIDDDLTADVPTFIDAVASAVGRRSASVTLLDRNGDESLVATSDATARLAHDVEFVMEEGPAHDVAARLRPLRVDSFELLERWPRYGPAVADHGVGSLIGLPLRQEPGSCFGALCIFDPSPRGAANVAAISGRVADALTHTVLNLPGAISDDEVPAVPLFDGADFHATVNRAAGIVAATLGCDLTDAVALLRARAFADGLPMETLAHRVIEGDVQI